MNKILITFSFLIMSFLSFSQEKVEKVKSSAIVYSNWSSTSRKLVVNDGLFGDSLGERANEVKDKYWSFGLGFRSDFSKHFMWEGGVSFQQNGEKYNYYGTDTSYHYRSKYMYISMPIKMYFKYGKSFRAIAGVGVVPQMFVKFKQSLDWTGPVTNNGNEVVKTTIGYNPFVVSAVFNVGVEMDFSEKITFFLIPEYKVQLTSSYLRNNSYKHFGRSLGFNVGFAIDI